MSQVSTADVDAALAAAEPIAPGAVTEGQHELRRLLDKPINAVAIDPDTGKLCPKDFAEVYLVARYLYDIGMLPDAYTKNRDPKQAIGLAMAAILQGRKHGMDPFEAVRWHYPVRTSLTLWGDAVPGVIKAALRKLGERVVETEKYEGEGEKLGYTITVKHMRGDVVLNEKTRQFSMADAKLAGLTGKGPWMTSPRRMLLARARTFAYRDAFPDLMMGLVVTEEAMDEPAEVEQGRAKSLDERLQAAKDPSP